MNPHGFTQQEPGMLPLSGNFLKSSIIHYLPGYTGDLYRCKRFLSQMRVPDLISRWSLPGYIERIIIKTGMLVYSWLSIAWLKELNIIAMATAPVQGEDHKTRRLLYWKQQYNIFRYMAVNNLFQHTVIILQCWLLLQKPPLLRPVK